MKKKTNFSDIFHLGRVPKLNNGKTRSYINTSLVVQMNTIRKSKVDNIFYKRDVFLCDTRAIFNNKT